MKKSQRGGGGERGLNRSVSILKRLGKPSKGERLSAGQIAYYQEEKSRT